ALLAPWSVWLGASTVPESFTASATAAAAIALGANATPARARVGFAIALLAACLSRYEPWPVAAVLAVVVTWRAVRQRSVVLAACALLAIAGPLAWLAWNRHAHGDALHFFARVSRFKRAIGEGSTDPVASLLLYPRLLVGMRFDVVLGMVLAGFALWGSAARRELAARWAVPLACAAGQLAFLAYGNVHDGSPAHHAERPLLAITFVLAFAVVDALGATFAAADMRGRRLRAAAVAVVCAAWGVTSTRGFRDVPGRAEHELRGPQVARGRVLREEGARALELTPCAYEHFALIAAYGAPENVTTRPSTNAPVTASCPAVESR
ncbi:MAG: hypothetical protein JWP97_6399, partial [Labilithrix sp.]|nr:hypothetical protein [Labilithrix sp.]